MKVLGAWLPFGRVLVTIDVALVLWTLAWVFVGMRVADEVDGLTRLSNTVVEVGQAIDSSAKALESVAAVPLVGDRLDGPVADIHAAGASAIASGRSSRESVHNLSPLLGFAIALIPTVPLLALYVPLRVGAVRERRELARLVQAHCGDPRLAWLLAQRALGRLPSRELAAAALAGGTGPDEVTTARLAQAELRRAGISPNGSAAQWPGTRA
jgi:hypothetical protein